MTVVCVEVFVGVVRNQTRQNFYQIVCSDITMKRK